MPDTAAVRAAILANVGGVADIGQVHDYERYDKNMAGMRGLYESNIGGSTQIRGWHLVSMTQKTLNRGVGIDDVATVWELRGFMGLDDANASEKTFDAKVEDVRQAMRADKDLGGVANTHDGLSDQAGWQVVEKNKVMFAGVLCHHVRLQLITWHTE